MIRFTLCIMKLAIIFVFTNILAALGLAQLESLSKYIKKKKIIHERYKKEINKIRYIYLYLTHLIMQHVIIGLIFLKLNKNLSKKKLSNIIKYLSKNGIEVRPLWHPNHLQKKYKNCQTYKLDNINNIYRNRLCIPSSSHN